MSTPHNNIFARWSYRKLAARDGEEAAVKPQNHLRDDTVESAGEPAGQRDATDDPDQMPAEPLPSIDELTAESDLSAFLRKGVPEALKRAALRKVWSLDPAIRDYVGPSEYAWDFNQPGAMAGFGPLDVSRLAARSIATMSSGAHDEVKDAAASTELSTPLQIAPSITDEAADPDRPARTVTADRTAEPSGNAGGSQTPPSGDQANIVEAAKGGNASQQAQSSPAGTRLRHGGAIPR
jgi:hypothetical protein